MPDDAQSRTWPVVRYCWNQNGTEENSSVWFIRSEPARGPLSQRRAFPIHMNSEMSKHHLPITHFPEVTAVPLTRGSVVQNRADLRKYGADAAGDIRHQRSRGYRDKARHQSVFDEVLSLDFLP
jgi:hypothetical protein